MQDSFLIKSVLKKKRKNIPLVALITILSFVLIGGSLFILVLGNGLKGLQKRLGADIMIIPAECENTAESLLMEGSREYFYFDRDVSENIRNVPGIDKITEQFYLASLAADCCTSKVGIVGFDPDTDFIIEPWVSEKAKGKMGKDKAIVGSQIKVEKDNTIRIFGRSYSVIYRLAETGTSLDTSAYFTMDNVPQLIADAESKGIKFLDSQKRENMISSVFIKLKDGAVDSDVARDIIRSQETDVDILYPEAILSSFARNAGHIASVAYAVLFVIWLVAELILLIAFYISACGRKKEFALLRVMGLSRDHLVSNIVKEALLLSVTGFIVGGFLSAITVFPFGRYLAYKLSFAYVTPTVPETFFIFLFALLVSIVSGIIASAIPIFKIFRLDEYSALREEE